MWWQSAAGRSSPAVMSGGDVGRSRQSGQLGRIVARAYRNQCVGQVVMDVLLVRAAAIGLRFVTLHVFSNTPRAIHLYEKMGFISCGRVPGLIRYRRQYAESIIMSKSLR